MASILQALKEKFPSIYELLLNNQKEKNLIFLGPNKQLYLKDYLNDKSFYYNHIFQKSQFDPNLYTNFYGKVLKCSNGETFETYLGWSEEMTINIIEEGYNQDGLFFYQTDGICIEKDSSAIKISKKQTIKLKRFNNSLGYIEHYSHFNTPEYKNFKRGIKSMESFVFSILNNYILLKGNEENFANILIDKINNFISAFEIIFKDKSPIAREFVDSYIFSFIYDKIMEKLDSFYSEEQKILKIKIDENIDKYGIIELNLDPSLANCSFEEIFEKIHNLHNYKTNFEKVKCLYDIYNSMINEIQNQYEKINGNSLEIQGDIINSCWIYVLANYIKKFDAKNIFNQYLFFKYFQIKKGLEEEDNILISFVRSVALMQEELLNKKKSFKVELIKFSSFD